MEPRLEVFLNMVFTQIEDNLNDKMTPSNYILYMENLYIG